MKQTRDIFEYLIKNETGKRLFALAGIPFVGIYKVIYIYVFAPLAMMVYDYLSRNIERIVRKKVDIVKGKKKAKRVEDAKTPSEIVDAFNDIS